MGNSSHKETGPRTSAIMEEALSKEGSGDLQTATFAGGCFWSVELQYQRLPGVTQTAVGYTDGAKLNPTYEEVCTGTTGHTEAVQMKYDPAIVSYESLVKVLLDKIDPTSLNRQGGDAGTQYRSGIYYHTSEQRKAAEAVIAEEQHNYDRQIVVEVKPATTFYKAEEYHQQYLEKGGQCSRKGDRTAIRCYG